jgi:23S rRNA (cytidine1920-2'-O)/16S rRNA (cytidine1409-2'-O)-methyltransferase
MIASIRGICNIHILAAPQIRNLLVKMRLDLLLVQRGIAETRSKAQDLIKRGAVRMEGRTSLKPSLEVSVEEPVEVLETQHYVARSAWKLLAALDHFALSAAGRTCLDVGAATGGFTQVLLERGAARVFAVDVGRNQLHPSLRADPRIISWESMDARTLTAAQFQAPIEAVTCDVSFISLLKVLPPVLPLAAEGAWLVVLVKPQFEVGRALIGKGGIVKDAAAKLAAVQRVADHIEAAEWTILGTLPSPIKGQDGNEETLAAARKGLVEAPTDRCRRHPGT